MRTVVWVLQFGTGQVVILGDRQAGGGILGSKDRFRVQLGEVN